MATLPKLKIGRKSDRNFFDFSHDVNTTAEFGFCQPTLIKSLIADSKVTLKSSSFVRLAPLPVPTFGRINVKQHTAFVPYRDVFLAWDNFQAQKSVQSAIRSYVPDCADTVTNWKLLSFLWNFSSICSDYNGYGNFLSNKMPFRFAVFTDVKTRYENIADQYPAYRSEYYDPLNDVNCVKDNDILQVKNAMNLYETLFNVSDFDGVWRSAFGYAMENRNMSYFSVLNSNFEICTDSSGVKPTVPHWTMCANIGIRESLEPPFPYAGNQMGSIGQLFEFPNENDKWTCSEPISLENADFVISLSADDLVDYPVKIYTEYRKVLDDIVFDEDSAKEVSFHDVHIAIRLTPFGRRLFKVLNACRINLNMDDSVEMMDLLSYYKVWFDKYNPGRNFQWLDTHAYYLIHHFYDFGFDTESLLYQSTFTIGSQTYELDSFRYRFACFITDLGNCFYSLPIDNITVATSDTVQNVDASSPDRPIYTSSNSGSETPVVDDVNSYGSGVDPQISGGLGLKLLERIYHYVNKNSVLGSRIDEYLKAHNIGSPLPASLVLGDNDYSVFVEDQFSTAETSEGYLGEFAGKAKQFNSPDTLKFETANAGTLVQLFCVVPFGGYVQSAKRGKRTRFDFYQSLYDSLGKQPLTMYEVCSRDCMISGLENSVFGFVPQYFNEKVVNNLANGGFSFRSQRSSFLPYSLDRIFAESALRYRNYTYKGVGGLLDYVVKQPYFAPPASLVPDEELRYIGKYEIFGHYDRIFYDTTGTVDNFIVQIVQDFKCFAPMKPVSESFDTFDKDVDNGVTQVSHA